MERHELPPESAFRRAHRVVLHGYCDGGTCLVTLEDANGYLVASQEVRDADVGYDVAEEWNRRLMSTDNVYEKESN